MITAKKCRKSAWMTVVGKREPWGGKERKQEVIGAEWICISKKKQKNGTAEAKRKENEQAEITQPTDFHRAKK